MNDIDNILKLFEDLKIALNHYKDKNSIVNRSTILNFITIALRKLDLDDFFRIYIREIKEYLENKEN